LTWLTGLTRSETVGSGSSGCGGSRAKRRGWIGSGASDFNPMAQDASKRRGGGVRRPAAATGDGLVGENLSRVPGLDSVRGKHLDAAHGTANPSRAALAADTRRRRHTKRRRGSGSGGAPASNCGRHGARGRRRATWVLSSPPGAALGELLDDEAAAAAKTENGGAA
jgi:hypothetical protein